VADDSRVPKIRPKNWARFQHYKHRRPPWIKLHRDLLDNFDFHCLQLASKALAPLLWLMASEAENGWIEVAAITFRLRLTSSLEEALSPLISSGFFECHPDASNVLAACKQNVTTEKSISTSLQAPIKQPALQRNAASKAKGTATWEAYALAYAARYGAPPVRNATGNTMVARFVDHLGAEEAPSVANFYLSHNDVYYVKMMHPLSVMLRDHQKLRTEWATGRKMTGLEARSAEYRDAVAEQVKRVTEKMEKP